MNAPISRRHFLQGTAAAAAGLAALSQLAAAETKEDGFGGFIVGIQSYTFRNFDLEQALKRTQALGLGYAELYSKHADPKSTPEQLKAVLKMCGDYGVKPVAFGVQSFTKDHDANKKMFEFGKALGIKCFSANPNPDSFDSLDKLCDEYKIAIGIHPHGPNNNKNNPMLDRWYSAEIILEAVKNHHELIGACLDTGHLIRSAQDPFNKKLVPQDQVRLMAKRNFGMHLKDHDNTEKRDVVFGKGPLDVAAVLKALKEVKFTGHLSIEYEHNPANPDDDVKACVAVIKDAAKKVAG